MHVGFEGNFACWAASCRRPLHSYKSKLTWNNSSFNIFLDRIPWIVVAELKHFTIPYVLKIWHDLVSLHTQTSLDTTFWPFILSFTNFLVLRNRCPMSSSTVRCHIAASPQVRRQFTEQAVWLGMKRMMLVDSVERVRKKCLRFWCSVLWEFRPPVLSLSVLQPVQNAVAEGSGSRCRRQSTATF